MDITIPEEYIVYDTRLSNDFKGITIGGYKRGDVVKAYQNAIINNKLEDAIRWCVELHSTGLNNQIWTSLKTVYMKYIHINNPKYFFYLEKREKEYLNIVDTYSKKHEIFSRNDQEIRNIFSELTSISTLTKKNNLFLQKSLPTINQSSFLQENIKMRMISKNTDYIEEYIFNNTTPEMKVALNEIINNLLFKYGTFENCIYWYQWMEKVESIQKNRLKPSSSLLNSGNGTGSVIFSSNEVNKNTHFDTWFFIIWNIMNNLESKLDKRDFKFIKKLEKAYKKNFKITQASNKKFYIFISFYIIKKNINWNIYIFQQEHLILQSVANINKMYKNVILSITNNLSKEQKDLLIKNYNIIQYEIEEKSKNIKKVKNTSLKSVDGILKSELNEDINKVCFTNYPDYIDISKSPDYNYKNENNENNVNYENYEHDISRHSSKSSKNNNQSKSNQNIISKNKTLQDVIDERELKKQKKLKAFTDFVSFKKHIVKTENSNETKLHKNVIEYYNLEMDHNINNENEVIEKINKKYMIDKEEINEDLNIKSIEFNFKSSKKKDSSKMYDD